MKSYLKMKTRFFLFIQTEKSATVYIIIKKKNIQISYDIIVCLYLDYLLDMYVSR